MKFTYDLSILIPVYNSAATLSETLDSVFEQKVDKDFRYEVLLVNDGSTDESEHICKELAKQHDNIKYFSHENKGVSYTRNRGLSLAEGKYILFLDSDDKLKSDTFQSIFNCFEKYGSQASLLAYPLYLSNNGKLKEHPRNINYKTNGVVDIEANPHINQTTMNIVIKNSSDKVFFDESLIMAEDAFYNTKNILKDNKLIICNKGGYIYVTDGFSSVDKYKNPAHSYKQTLDYFLKLIEVFGQNETISPYVQSMILYELNWRFRGNNLFPYHLEQADFDDWSLSFERILNLIDNSTILSHPTMDFYHKRYFLSKRNKDIKLINDSTGIYFYDKEGLLLSSIGNFELIFTKFKNKNNTLNISGYIKAPFLNLLNELNLIVRDNNGNIHSTNLYESPSSFYKSKIKSNIFYGFEFSLPIKQDNYTFEVHYKDSVYQTTPYFSQNSIFDNKKIKSVLIDNVIVEYDKTPFSIMISDNISPSKKIKKYRDDYKIFRKMGFEKVFYFKLLKNIMKDKKEIWIYNDRPNLFDNSYEQFKHDVQKDDGVARFYVTYIGENISGKFTKEEEKYLVLYNSLKHKLLYCNARYIITSFQGKKEYCPFYHTAEKLLLSDIKHEVIYLQHGILHAHTPWIYSKEKSGVDKFLISTEFERKNLTNHYGYRDSDLIKNLMPRFQNLNKDISLKKNKILFAPSWRSSLTKGMDGLKWLINEEAFLHSSFYNGIMNFLNSEALEKFLSENNLKLDFNLHPIFREYSHLFKISNKFVDVIVGKIQIEEYKLYINDFSSFVFDFAYLNTPVLFFVPDYDEFLCGNHSYSKLDLPFEDSFGPLTKTTNELLEKLYEWQNNHHSIFKGFEETYTDFFYNTENPLEKTYFALKNL